MQAALPTVTPWPAIGALTTLVGTALSLYRTWVKEKNAIARRIQVLEEGKQYLEFWKTYADTASGVLGEDDFTTLSKMSVRNFKLLSEYIEYEVTRPIEQTVIGVPTRWVRQQIFKERAKQVAKTFAIVTPFLFVLLGGTNFILGRVAELARERRLTEFIANSHPKAPIVEVWTFDGQHLLEKARLIGVGSTYLDLETATGTERRPLDRVERVYIGPDENRIELFLFP